LPWGSHVGPSVNEKSLESFSSFAPGATTPCAEAQTIDAAKTPTTIAIVSGDVIMFQVCDHSLRMQWLFELR
jgi:hypothetical protein